jgi:hypothetical protein
MSKCLVVIFAIAAMFAIPKADAALMGRQIDGD